MSTPVTIIAGGVSLEAELNDSKAARAVADALPLEGIVSTWGEEIYFRTPLELGLDAGARADMAVGELGYWPDGRAVCIFFGTTPASETDGAPRAVGPVDPIGRVQGDATALRSVKDGAEIAVRAAG